MSFESDIWDALTDDNGLAAVISDRLYWDSAPEAPTVPFIIGHVFDMRREQAMAGAVVVSRPVVNFTIWDDDHAGALAVADALRAALLATDYPVILAGERSEVEYQSGLHRRTVEARISYVGS